MRPQCIEEIRARWRRLGLNTICAGGCTVTKNLGVKERLLKNMVLENQIELKTGTLTHLKLLLVSKNLGLYVC